MREVVLNSGWQLKEWTAALAAKGGADGVDETAAARPEGWIAAPVPGLVHEALLAAGQIEDPCRVGSHPALEPTFHKDYLYRCRFDRPVAAGTPVVLVFDGLDTVVTVWLNGHEILRSDNMFVPQQVEVTALLRPHDNTLYLRFESALRVGQARQALGGARPVWNGDASRVYVRKAQYHYGWDFGPTLLSAGPWRPVRLRCGHSRLLEVHAPVEVAADLGSATVALRVTATAEPGLTVALELTDPQGQVIAQGVHPLLPDGVVRSELLIATPALWWPRPYGGQPLYTLRTRLQRGDEVLDERSLRLGVRRLRLQQDPLPDGGTSFCFEINNQAIFCGGANWIPADLLNPRVTQAHYRALLSEAVAAEMTMLRVWGGGIYEEDVFYDLCDELGLLVFQDFMFACGMYPGADRFAASVAAEATAAVRRLRHHPSVVIWAGNNEDYSIAQSKSSYAGPGTPIPGAADPQSAGYCAQFDGRRLYEEVLPEAVAANDQGPGGPSRPYWPGSPYSRISADPNAKEEGDRHIWDVWHSPLRDYQDYPLLAGRFVSEFGMQAIPSRATVARALGTAADSPELTQEALGRLNHGQDGPTRISHYIEHNLPLPRDFDEYLYATQVIQAEALGHALRGFRRGFGTVGARAVSGALVWQLDDCWPGVSWAMLEHLEVSRTASPTAVRRKPSFYAVRRELLPLALGMAQRTPGAASQEQAVELWAAQSGGRAQAARLLVRAFTLGGESVFREERTVSVGENQVTELGPVVVPAGPLVVGAQLWAGETLLARAVLWPQPLHKLALQDPELSLQLADRAGEPGSQTLRVRARRPAKAVLLTAEGEARFGDNLLDLLPDEEVAIEVGGLGTEPLRAVSLYSVRP
jgi:beta-mannosidase